MRRLLLAFLSLLVLLLPYLLAFLSLLVPLLIAFRSLLLAYFLPTTLLKFIALRLLLLLALPAHATFSLGNLQIAHP